MSGPELLGPRMRRRLPPSARPRWAWLQGLPLRRRRLRRILGLLAGRTPRRGNLADVGAGAGVTSEEAVRMAPADAYYRSLLLEPQRGMLERGAGRKFNGIQIERIRGEGSRLPFADGVVDIVLSFGVLCCMEEGAVPAAVSEFWRALRPGGYCLLAVPRRWAGTCEPLFATRGFVKIRELRPGRVLYQRPRVGEV